MKKIKRMYIIIILTFIIIVCGYTFKNIWLEETGQTAKKENDSALHNFEVGLNAMPMSEMEMEEHEEQNELTGRLEAYYKTFLF